ncbi:Hypothetical predicted protein [Olea europaea subsp. europaea]|uniref:Uncharacterized protein n=1 Tax=Olea europaea subsp. europaea TaxID=158383 RepID=A0A8S0TYZ7_OLEEU|nr:Hypothetical predicted protein [Olea europaea subsp. europaea]
MEMMMMNEICSGWLGAGAEPTPSEGERPCVLAPPESAEPLGSVTSVVVELPGEEEGRWKSIWQSLDAGSLQIGIAELELEGPKRLLPLVESADW